jgi:hypothetical protein
LLKLLVVMMLFFCVGASLKASPFTHGADGNSELFPAVSGYDLTFEPTVYDPSNLWMFIDGAAELFLVYGFVDLHVAYYRNGGVEVRAEVYRHDRAEKAFGIYSQERSPDCTFVKIGVQGYVEEGGMNFLSGRSYVKLSANRSDSTVQQSIMLVGQRIADALGESGSWPEPLALLPKVGRIQNSEQYIAESYLGYTFLRGAYTARYGAGGDIEIFVISAGSEADASSMASALAAASHVSTTTGPVRTIPDAHQGDVTLVIQGRHVAGILRCKDLDLRAEFVKFLQSSVR